MLRRAVKAEACTALRAGQSLCANGFLQTSACRPQPCYACGTWREGLRSMPWCMREEFPPHMDMLMLDDSGKPRPRTEMFPPPEG